jgi:hypothetical protein
MPATMFRTARARVLAISMLAVACATKQGTQLREVKPPAPPAVVPETWDFTDVDALPEQEDAVMSACAWLLDVAPATADGKTWVHTRDFALDWIEASRKPEIPVTQPIVAYVATDRRFMYGVYMRGAYQCGKAKWVLAHPGDDTHSIPSAAMFSLDAEIAGIDAMRRLTRALQKWDPDTGSRRLRKLDRAQKQGKLDAKLTKIIAKDASGSGRKKRR